MKRLLITVGLAHFAFSAICLGRDFRFFEPVQPPRPFQVMVHRGEANQAPENTRAALQRCIEDGLEWAEVDVRLTKDGQHILSHDAKIAAGPNATWQVDEHTLAELLTLDVGSTFASRYAGERLLPLKDCLQLAKGKVNLYLDCKDVDPEQLAGEVLAAGMADQVVVYDKLESLARVRQASQGKVASMAKWRPAFALPAWAVTNQLDAVEIDADEITPAVSEAFHDLGLKVQTKNLGPWDTPEFWDKAIAARVDWIQTDLPEELLAHALWQRVPKRPVRISLHRGALRYAPENTLPAFEKAIRLGVDFVEFDVRTASDGKFYLLHDGTLDGKTDGQGPIANTPSSVIATLSAGVKFGRQFAEVRLPTLDDFLKTVAGRVDLYFDAKAISPEALSEAVGRYRMAERTVVYQSPDYLLRLRAINPRIRALPPLGAVEELDTLAAKLKSYAVDARWSILSRELIARCHALGILVFSDALGAHERIEDYLQAMDWGIDLIQTDHPLRVMRAIELRAAKAR
ncbi:MAG: glycerophosphodiester phosphodiesterase family protein [Verrucomicrobia bacterium]|nr:glycerophosphodiester phosphodiesterase family protein [Verrucomicrobiota bacterium]